MTLLRPSTTVASAQLEVKKSQFTGFITRTETVESALDFLTDVRTEHPKATHHVYAFIIGHPPTTHEGMSDDGEPSGTAGPPSLAVLRGSHLGDITLVTVRYYGGINLGTGGLVKAYTEVAQQTLVSTTIVEKHVYSELSILCEYTWLNTLTRVLATYQADIQSQEYQQAVTITCYVQQAYLAQLLSALADATNGQVSATVTQPSFYR